MARRRWLTRFFLALLLLFVLAQLVPYGRTHDNPQRSVEPAWDSKTTRDLVARACFDCHSNATHWPGYAGIAPSSWLVQSDVDEGRENLNFSEWDKTQQHAVHAANEVREGDMPPLLYRLMHPEARLSDAERAALVQGLTTTLGSQAHED